MRGSRSSRAHAWSPARHAWRAAWGHRRGQALALVAISALITACTAFAPVYDRAMQQALVDTLLAQATPAEASVALVSESSDFAGGAIDSRDPREVAALIPDDVARTARPGRARPHRHRHADDRRGPAVGPAAVARRRLRARTPAERHLPGRARRDPGERGRRRQLRPRPGHRSARSATSIDEDLDVPPRGRRAPTPRRDDAWWQGQRTVGISSITLGLDPSANHDAWLTVEQTFVDALLHDRRRPRRPGHPCGTTDADVDSRARRWGRGSRRSPAPWTCAARTSSSAPGSTSWPTTVRDAGRPGPPHRAAAAGADGRAVRLRAVARAHAQRPPRDAGEVAVARLRGRGPAGAAALLLLELLPALLVGVVPGALVALGRRGRGQAPAPGGRAVRGRPRVRARRCSSRWSADRADHGRRRRPHGPRAAARRGAQRPGRLAVAGRSGRSTRSWSRAWAPAWSPSPPAASRVRSRWPDRPCWRCSPASCSPTWPAPPVGSLGRRLLGRGRLVARHQPARDRPPLRGTHGHRRPHRRVRARRLLDGRPRDRRAQPVERQPARGRRPARGPGDAGGDLDGVRSALAAADPTGRRATPVLVGRDTLAVEPDAFRRIAFFPRGAPTAEEWRAIAPPDRRPVEITGSAGHARRADRRRARRRRHLRQRGRRAPEPRPHLRHRRTPCGLARLPARPTARAGGCRARSTPVPTAADWPRCSSRRRRAPSSTASSSSPTCASTAATVDWVSSASDWNTTQDEDTLIQPVGGGDGRSVRLRDRRGRVLPGRGVPGLGARPPCRPC